MIKNHFVVVLCCFAVLSCQKSDFLYYQAPVAPPPIESFTHRVNDLKQGGKVDMLWVIDDSASMFPYQQSVSQNIGDFMNHLTKMGLDWRIGLITTDFSEKPREGFDPSNRFTSNDPNPVLRMQNAITLLGTSGSGTEMAFIPVKKHLSDHPDFMRQDSYLAVFVVTDAPEQSNADVSWMPPPIPNPMDSQDFLDFVTLAKGDLKKVLMYGAFGAQDLQCPATDDYWLYKGSRYEKVVDATHGSYFPLCDPNFGTSLSGFAKDLVQKVSSPRIYLKGRPVVSTLKVLYHGNSLKGGSVEENGLWYYNFEHNAIFFYDVSFATGDQDEVVVEYQPAG